MLAYMATRVLGQYDLLINDEAPEDQDLVSYVGPNIVAVEDAVRLRAERVPSVARAARGDPPPAVHRGALAARPLRRPGHRAARAALGRPGRAWPSWCAAPPTSCGPGATRPTTAAWSACWPRPSSGWRLSKISGMMSLLEGHGDVTMDRAGAGRGARRGALLPGAARAADPGAGADQADVEAARASTPRCASTPRASASSSRWRRPAGPPLLARVWEGPEWLPTLEEIRDPAAWVARAGG